MKKNLAFLLAACLIIGTLTACGGSNGSSPASAGASSSEPSSGSAPKERVELMYWHYHTLATYDVMMKYFEDYNKDESNPVIIKEQYIPRNDLIKKYTLGVVSGDLPDLAMIDNPDSATYAAMGMYTDITDRFNSWEDNKFLEGPLATGKYNGKQYTLPTRSNCLSVWANDEMLKAAGVTKTPETWDEFNEVCSKLKAANPKVYPFAFAAPKNEEATFQFIPFLYSTGAAIDTFGSDGGVRALEFVTGLVNEGYSSPEVINWTQNDVEKQFAAGNCAMMFNGCWHISNMAKDAPDLKYSVFYLPKDKDYASCMGGENIGITTKCKDVDAAWEFVSWWLSSDISVGFNTQVGTISPHSNISAAEQYPDDPVMQKFTDQLAYAVPRGPSPKWGEISTAVQDALQASLSGTKTPAAAAAEAASKIEQINQSIK